MSASSSSTAPLPKGGRGQGLMSNSRTYYDGDREEAARFRFAALSELADDRYDIQIFSFLPLYVRTEVLRGKVIYCPDERFLYDVAYQTIREFDDFKHRLYDYIGKEAMV